MLPIFWNEDRSRVNLGDIERMLPSEYERLFLYTWSGGALVNSTEVPQIQRLGNPDRRNPYMKIITNGTWRLVIEDAAIGAWAAAAAFLRMWPKMEPIIRSSYAGALRLRWKAATLYVLVRSSPLLEKLRLPVTHSFERDAFPYAPVLYGPDVRVALAQPGQSCDSFCASQFVAGRNGLGGVEALRCHGADLLFLNSCKAMQAFAGHGACTLCSPGNNQEQPSVVLEGGDFGGPTASTCMYNANLAEPPSCSAAHAFTARLCACRPVFLGEIALDPDASSSHTILPAASSSSPALRTPIYILTPVGLADPAVDSGRCGAEFANKLGSGCHGQGWWCCSEEMKCGNDVQHCGHDEGDSDCRSGARPNVFCGSGWTLRLRQLNLLPPADR
jgi:hypothetical protein